MVSSRLLLLTFSAFALVAGCTKQDNASAPGGGPPSASKGGRGAGQVQPVEVTTVTRRTLVEPLNVVGSLAANESATIRPEINGLLVGIYFEEGQHVKKGAVLAKIDDGELRAQVAQSEARFQLTEQNLKRAENLRSSQSNTQADVDRARSEHAGSVAELSLLRIRLDRTSIKAPFDGVVAARTLSPGDYVTAQSILTTLDDLSRLKVQFQVPERYLAKVKNGTRFEVKAKGIAADTDIGGEIYFVSSVIDRATRSSETKGLLLNPPPALKPGMFANIELILDVREGALTVPEGSILTAAAGPQVIAIKDQGSEKIVEFIPVRVGLRARGFAEIAALKGESMEGRSIVASGVGGLILYPGAKVEPRPLREEFRGKEN